MKRLVSALGIALFSSVACAHKPPPIQTFHYRRAAHPTAVGETLALSLDGNAPTGYADSLVFHLPETGALQLTTDSVPGRAAVLVYTSGAKPLAQARAGSTLTTPMVQGEVFVVVRALRGTGSVHLNFSSAFQAAPQGTPAAPPTNASTVLPPLKWDDGTDDLPLPAVDDDLPLPSVSAAPN